MLTREQHTVVKLIKIKEFHMKMNKFVALGLVAAAVAGSVIAGGDTTFGSVASTTSTVGKIISFLNGSLGLMLSLLALVIAVASAVAGKLTGVVTALGVAIAIQVGPTVVQGMFTATL
jgi:hypothetical protein